MLNLYSSPPSRKLICLIRRTFFSSSESMSWDDGDATPDPPREMHPMPTAMEAKDGAFDSTTRII